MYIKAFLPPLLGTFLFTACSSKEPEKKAENNTEQQAKEKPETSAKPKVDEPTKKELAQGQALNAYVHCINTLSTSISKSHARYVSWAGRDAKKLPTGKEIHIDYGITNIPEPNSRCLTAIESLEEFGDSELFAVGIRYVKAANEVVDLVKIASNYYKQGDYKDDKAAKAKEWHPLLLSALKAFRDVDIELRSKVDAVSLARAQARLKRMEEAEGRSFEVLRGHVMNQTKALIAAADASEQKIDWEALNARQKRFSELLVELDTYIAEHSKELKVYSNSISFPDIPKKAHGFELSLKNFLRHHRDQEKWSKQDLGRIQAGHAERLEGHISHVIRSYNELIAVSNRVKRPR